MEKHEKNMKKHENIIFAIFDFPTRATCGEGKSKIAKITFSCFFMFLHVFFMFVHVFSQFEVRPDDFLVVCGPGLRKTELNKMLKPHGFIFGVDPASDPSVCSRARYF